MKKWILLSLWLNTRTGWHRKCWLKEQPMITRLMFGRLVLSSCSSLHLHFRVVTVDREYRNHCDRNGRRNSSGSRPAETFEFYSADQSFQRLHRFLPAEEPRSSTRPGNSPSSSLPERSRFSQRLAEEDDKRVHSEGSSLWFNPCQLNCLSLEDERQTSERFDQKEQFK